MMKSILFVLIATICLCGCKESVAEGQIVGTVCQLVKGGMFWESWEGSLNPNLTGMECNMPFKFSIDNERADQDSLARILSQAQVEGWKIKIRYYETNGSPFSYATRGSSSNFIEDIEVLDKSFAKSLLRKGTHGHIIDTIYVVNNCNCKFQKIKNDN